MRNKPLEFHKEEHPEMQTLTPILMSYLHARVTIYYREAGYSDTGHITYFDREWLELTKPNGERLLMPRSAIRIIKMLETGVIDSDAMMLLRPAESDSETKRIAP